MPYEADSLEILGEFVDIYLEGDRYAEHNIPAQLWSAWHEYNESRREDQIVNKYLYADVPKEPKTGIYMFVLLRNKMHMRRLINLLGVYFRV